MNKPTIRRHLIDELGSEIIDQMLNDTKERQGNGPVILRKSLLFFFKGMYGSGICTDAVM